MIEKYIESFHTGSMDAHRDSQRAWIKDEAPVIETNLGYVERLLDPENVRAYWQGWVCISDKAQTEKF